MKGSWDLRSTASPALANVISTLGESSREGETLGGLTIDYPLDGSIFPPEIISPTIIWHDSVDRCDTWLLELRVAGVEGTFQAILPGAPPSPGPIDERCLTTTNEIYLGTAYQASARTWKVPSDVWTAMKRATQGRLGTLSLSGFHSADPSRALSRGEVAFNTSSDPVGAPIFYRDVPLAPSSTEEGLIKPLSEAFLPLIAWRLRDISRTESRLLLTDLLTCTNCHSFSSDGRTLAMDVDGPAGDKGAYAIAPIAKETVIEKKHVISWNSFPMKPKGHKTIGFLSQISPDGRYVATTLNEAVYVQNFADYRFLQVFYPTRGILGYYNRASGEIKPLPGADDPNYVHCDPAWSPDGEFLVFARAEARDPYPRGYRPARHPNDPAEPQIQYDLYRIPFRQGQGGRPEPIAGASHNGMSNTFPRISPDGKWIVFVQCRNGQLLRPDSQLWIVPTAGGTARRMRCNTPCMNSWHSFSPNGRWLVFASKANTPYTQMFLTYLGEDGNDSPAILIPDSTAANRAVNLPEFVNIGYEDWTRIRVAAAEYLQDGMRGIRLFEQGRLDEALEHFESAVRKQPDYLEGHVSAAVIFIEKGRLDEAVSRLEKALAVDPECWFAHANLGLICQRRGDQKGAIAHFRKAVENNPKHLTARANLARALAEQGRLEEATIHFRAAADLAPRHAESRLNLGTVLLEQGLLEEAIQHYRLAVELDPKLPGARLGLADALTQRGTFAEAIAQYRAARSLDPADPSVMNGLAWILATCPDNRLRDGLEAERLAEEACRATERQNPLHLRTLSAAQAELGKWTDASATAAYALRMTEGRDVKLADQLRRDLEDYRQKKPIRIGDP